MRRVLSFAIALGLVVGGVYILLLHVLSAQVIRGIVLAGGAGMAAIGVGWLWGDFIAPMIARKTSGAEPSGNDRK